MNKTQLREHYLDTLRRSQSGKQLVAKSGSAPRMFCVRNRNGDVIGFGPGERLSPAEIADLKQDVAKSTKTGTEADPNAVFDSLFCFGSAQVTNSVNVSKSADDENKESVLDGVFPLWLQPN